MSRANTSSVDMEAGYRLAELGKQQIIASQAEFQTANSDSDEQIVNARKAVTLAQAKAKAKKKAKMAKASRNKNKK